MTITSADAATLLAFAAAFDCRKTGEADAEAWRIAGEIADWNFDDARRAIAAYYAETPGKAFVRPGDITVRIREHHRQRTEVNHSRRTLRAARRELWAAEDEPRDPYALAELHAEANMRACPGCRAKAGEPCRNPINGNTSKAPHHSRIRTPQAPEEVPQ